MNLFGLSPGELLLILMVAMVVLGPEKLPEVAASLGKWIREFRRATEELSAQFAGDNPLIELQRALSLTDEPPPPPVQEGPAQPELTYSPSDASVTTTLATPTPSPQISAPVRHDYFAYPQTYPSISDAWTHGSLPEAVSRNGHTVFAEGRFIADEWTHGVPVTPAPVASLDGQAGASSLASEPLPGVSAHVEFTSVSSSDATNARASETVPLPGNEPAAATEPAPSADDESPDAAGGVGESVEVLIPRESAPNGTVSHPADTVSEPIPAAAGEHRDGDVT